MNNNSSTIRIAALTDVELLAALERAQRVYDRAMENDAAGESVKAPSRAEHREHDARCPDG